LKKVVDDSWRGKALIIQPGAIGDGILTLPLARMLLRQGRMKHVDIMGHREKLGFLQGRSEITKIVSIEGVSLHKLFADHETFNLSEDDPLIEVFCDYELIVTFLTDEQRYFERNLIFTTASIHPVEVATIQLRPPGDYPGHVANFFMEQFTKELPHWLANIWPEFMQGTFIHKKPDDTEKAHAILKNRQVEQSAKIVLIHPGSGGREKCWPIENFRDLAEQLTQHGCQPVLLLGPVELERWDNRLIAELEEQLPILQELTLEEVTIVLSCCDAYVGNDTGITHLAGAMGLATVAIFGPTNVASWQPLGTHVRICVEEKTSNNTWTPVENVLNQLKNMI